MELRKFGKKDHVILFFGIPLQIHKIADFLLTLLAFRERSDRHESSREKRQQMLSHHGVRTHTPRPCVAAKSKFRSAFNLRSATWTFGSPVWKRDHVTPTSVETYTPLSLPT